jgi:hypothetical protein
MDKADDHRLKPLSQQFGDDFDNIVNQRDRSKVIYPCKRVYLWDQSDERTIDCLNIGLHFLLK